MIQPEELHLPEDLYFEYNGQIHIRYCRACGEYVKGSWVVCMDCITLYCWKCASSGYAAAYNKHQNCKHISAQGNWAAGVGQGK